MKFIELRGGLILREDCLLLALRIEDQNHSIATSDGKLTVTNGAALSPELREQIKDCRLHLMALAAYEPPEAR